MKFKAKGSRSFLIKVSHYMKNGWGVELIGSFETLFEAREAANDYEKNLADEVYKREFCMFDELDGIHKGFCFTVF